jgi:hypothetical protein
MACLNGYGRLEELPGVCRLLRSRDRDPLIASIAAHTGLDADAVGRLGLGRSGAKSVSFGASALRLSQVRVVRPRLCPACFAADGVHRMVWDVALVDACPLHRCGLEERCAGCGWRFGWPRLMADGCWRCGRPHRPGPPIGGGDLRGTALAYVVLGDARVALPSANALPPWLWAATPAEAIDLLAMLGSVSIGKVRKGSAHAGPQDPSERRRRLAAAHDCLLDWPSGFHAMLERTGKPAARRGLRPSISTCWPLLHSLLSNRPKVGVWTEVGVAIDGHASRTRDLIIQRRRDDPRGRHLASGTLSASEAALRLGLTPRVVGRLVERGILAGRRVGDGKSARLLLETEDVRRLREDLSRLISAKEARGVLRVDALRLRSMIEAGLLRPKFLKGELLHMQLIPRSQVERLVGGLKSKVANPGTLGRTVTLRHLARSAVRAGHTLGQVFDAISAGRISPCAEDELQPLFARFRFAASDAKSLLAHLADDLPDHLVSRDTAAKDLGVGRPVLDAMVVGGLISAVMAGKGVHVLMRSDVDGLCAEWTHVGRLAKDLRSSRGAVTRLLARLRVNPDWVGSVAGGRTFKMFRIAGLAGLDLSVEIDGTAVHRRAWRKGRE